MVHDCQTPQHAGAAKQRRRTAIPNIALCLFACLATVAAPVAAAEHRSGGGVPILRASASEGHGINGVGGRETEERVILTQLLHRHGSRAPLNVRRWCSDGTRCGQLNPQGRDMLAHLGRALRRRYTVEYPTDYFSASAFAEAKQNQNTVADEADRAGNIEGLYSVGNGGGSDTYDFRVVHTRSTDVHRAIQSAEAMLGGMFSSSASTTTLPVVFTVEGNGKDRLLAVNGNPAYHLPLGANVAEYQRSLQPLINRLFGGGNSSGEVAAALLRAIGSEASIECGPSMVDGACAVELADLGLCLASSGNLSQVPLLETHLGALVEVNEAYSRRIWGYTPPRRLNNLAATAMAMGEAQSELDARRGSPGQRLAQEMIAKMRRRMAGPMNTKGYDGPSVVHYSGHDSSVTPFSVTVMGEADPRAFMPPFGEALLIDLIYVESRDAQPRQRYDGATAAESTNTPAGEFFVRGARGAPGQTPSNHSYDFGALRLGGIDAAGRLYATEAYGDRMPFEDFARFVASTEGTDGLCYVDAATREARQCNTNVTARADCRSFRMACGSVGCPAGSIIRDYKKLECIPIPAGGGDNKENGEDNNSEDRIALNTVLAVSAVTFAIGFVFGVIALWRVGKIKLKSSAATSLLHSRAQSGL